VGRTENYIQTEQSSIQNKPEIIKVGWTDGKCKPINRREMDRCAKAQSLVSGVR
jgi:hypothetical protein